jgi:hypothetical protein
MRRVETYVSQQAYEWLFSSQAQLTMTGIAKVCSALFDTSGTVNRLACALTGRATMAVQIGCGRDLPDGIARGNDMRHAAGEHDLYTLLKQDIQLGTYTATTFATPGMSGQSINHLIEAQYHDSDISLDPTTANSPVALQFYISTNPSTPWPGPNNRVCQQDRPINIVSTTAFSTSTVAASPTSSSISSVAPPNAKAFDANTTLGVTGSSGSSTAYLTASSVVLMDLGTETGCNPPNLSNQSGASRTTMTVQQTSYYVFVIGTTKATMTVGVPFIAASNDKSVLSHPRLTDS